MSDLAITNGTIISSGANYAVITSTNAGVACTLSGRPYTDNQNSVTIKSDGFIEGTQEKIEKIEDCYLVNKTNSQQVALMISMFALLLPVILLSGFIFPVENMPAFLQYLSLIMPPRWFIIIIKNIMLKGVGIEYVWKETLILAAMTIFLLTVSTKKLKTRLA